MGWVPLQESFEDGHSLSRLIRLQVNLRECDVRGVRLWAFLEKRFKKMDSDVALTTRDQHCGEIVSGLAIVGATIEGVAEVTLGAVEVAGAAEKHAEVVERFGKVWLEGERFFVKRTRVGVVASKKKSVSEIVERVRILGVGGERLAEAGDGAV